MPLSFLTLFLAFLALSTSAPSLAPRQSSPQQYYLRTSIVDATNDTGTPKDNLYVQAYHTGAGLNDVVLISNVSDALSGYFNTTNPSGGPTNWIASAPAIPAGNETLYWEMCSSDTPYGNWDTITINLGNSGCGYFYADGDLLVYGQYGGWLACDWWHGLPQLFLITDEAPTEPFVAPTSCSVVDLQMVSVEEDGVDDC